MKNENGWHGIRANVLKKKPEIVFFDDLKKFLMT